jgi:hypothetical protein
MHSESNIKNSLICLSFIDICNNIKQFCDTRISYMFPDDGGWPKDVGSLI